MSNPSPRAKPYLRLDGPFARVIVVGDVHGCLSELQDLLATVAFCSRDLVVCVGDMLDRGPASWEVARFFRDTPNAVSALGNHERRVAGVARGTANAAWTQRQTLSRLPEGQWDDWAAWLESLPAVVETPEVIVTHARLDPQRSISEQDPYFTCAVGGENVQIEMDPAGVPLWFHSLSPIKPVCMGHISYQRVELVPGRLFALDTKAVNGGRLTAAIFPGGETVSVPAARNYYDEAWKEWRRSLLPRGPVEEWPVKTAAKLLAATAHEDAEFQAARASIRAYLQQALDSRSSAIEAALRHRFGPVPAPGPRRGAYYKEAREAFAQAHQGAFVGRYLQGKVRSGEDLLVFGSDGCLREVPSALDELVALCYRGGESA